MYSLYFPTCETIYEPVKFSRKFIIMINRIANLFKGFMSKFIGGVEKKNPEVLLEIEKENLRKQIAQFNQGLANHAALVEKLVSRARTLDKEEAQLKAKTTALLKAGQREAAAKTALDFKKAQTEHDDIKSQLEDAEARYKELVNARDVSIKGAKSKIEELRRGIDDMKVQTAMADLNEMASGMIGEIGGSGDNLNRLSEIVEEERTKAAGRARVSKDSMDLTDVKIQEAEQDALAEMALADFAADAGIELESATPAQTPEKSVTTKSASQPTMGPASE